MNKKLLIALGAAFAASAAPAMADTSSVQLIGRIQAEFGSVKIDNLSGNRRQNAIADNAHQSRFGMRINEDLGNGLSAIAFIDWRFGTGAGTGPVAREQWVGLAGKNWGSVTFGRVNSPFKTYGHTAYDLFVATNLQLRGSGGAMWAPADGFGAGGFVDHAARFESPKWGGFQFAAMLAGNNADQADPTLSGGAAGGPNANTGGRGNGVDFQLAGRFDFGMGEVVAGYSRDQANDAQRAAAPVNGKRADDETAWMVGGKLKFGDWGFFAQYDRIRDALAQASGGGTATRNALGVITAGTGIGSISGSGCVGGASAAGNNDTGITTNQCNTMLNTNGDGNIWSLGTNWKIGNTTLVLQGGRTKANSIGAAPERRASNVTVGAIHALSKRTTVFGGYQRVNVNSTVSVTPATTPASTTSDADRKTWSIGMRHNF